MSEEKGLFVVIEGADGSGKATQSEMLYQALQAEGIKADLFAFPRYEHGNSGKLVGGMLTGKYGDYIAISPYFSSLPFTIDRMVARNELCKSLCTNEIVVSDRFTPSALCHQGSKLEKKEERAEFIHFLEQLEYTDLKLPRPDIVVYLGVPTETASQLVEQKAQRSWLSGAFSKKDVPESNTEHQIRASGVYRELAEERDNWYVVECVVNGTLRSKEDIHKEVLGIVRSIKATVY